MNISVVIPNYNGKKLLQDLPKVLHILEEYTDGSKELVIADDASKDNSVVLIEDFINNNRKSDVKIILLKNTTGKNQGFAINVNKAVKMCSGEIIILLNTDVIPRDNFLGPLLSHFSNSKIFAVGCLDESVENGKTTLRGRGIGEWRKGFLVHRRGSVDKTDTLWVSGGSGAFRKSIWDMLGGFNKLYSPFYWEDIDICYRAQKAGYQVVFEKKSIVRHEHETGSIKTNYSPFYVRTIAYRNQFFFTWLNATDTILIASHIFWLPYHMFRSLIHHDRAFFYGLALAIFQLPHVVLYRASMERLYTKTDREVIYT